MLENGSNSDIVLGRLHKVGRKLAQNGYQCPTRPALFYQKFDFF